MILGEVLVHIDNYNFTNFYLIQMEKQNSTDQCLFKNDANEKKGTNGSKTGGNVLFSKKTETVS